VKIRSQTRPGRIAGAAVPRENEYIDGGSIQTRFGSLFAFLLQLTERGGVFVALAAKRFS
jgi:hypothetical protein